MKMKMNPIGFFADLMTSKYFLWFISIISAVNIIGYISMGYIEAVVLFAMVAYLTFVFSKNMTVVLLVSFIVVNLYMHKGMIFEGIGVGSRTGGVPEKPGDIGKIEPLVNKEDVMPGDDDMEMEEPETETTEIQEEDNGEDGIEGLRNNNKKKINNPFKKGNAKMNKKATKESFKEGTTSKTNREGLTRKTDNFQGFEDVEAAPTKKHSHIDYGTTLEDAYKNLEKMLGEEGLQNLTSDTKKLMEQQSKLFNSMENIAPLLAQAQNMMKGMDMSGKVGGLADSAEEIHKSKQ